MKKTIAMCALAYDDRWPLVGWRFGRSQRDVMSVLISLATCLESLPLPKKPPSRPLVLFFP